MVAERPAITSLQKPPEGWFWSQEGRERRRSHDGGGYNSRSKGGANPWEASTAGPRADAEPTVTLPTLMPGRDKLPQACIFCRSRLLSQEPPMGEHQFGTLTCTGCGRQLAWLSAPLPEPRPVVRGSLYPRPPSPQAALPTGTLRPVITGRFNRLPGCSGGCSISYGHDAESHERYGREQALAESAQRPTGTVQTGPLTVDFDRDLVSIDGTEVRLTDVEHRLMSHLANRLGKLCPHTEIVEIVWGSPCLELWGKHRDGAFRNLQVNINRLRAKLGPFGSLIENRLGRGYRLRVEPPTGGAS